MEIPTNYNIMLTTPAKTFTSIPRNTPAAFLVEATESLEQTTFAHQDTDEPSIIIQIQRQQNW